MRHTLAKVAKVAKAANEVVFADILTCDKFKLFAVLLYYLYCLHFLTCATGSRGILAPKEQDQKPEIAAKQMVLDVMYNAKQQMGKQRMDQNKPVISCMDIINYCEKIGISMKLDVKSKYFKSKPLPYNEIINYWAKSHCRKRVKGFTYVQADVIVQYGSHLQTKQFKIKCHRTRIDKRKMLLYLNINI